MRDLAHRFGPQNGHLYAGRVLLLRWWQAIFICLASNVVLALCWPCCQQC